MDGKQTTAPKLSRFWIVSGSDCARIELCDGIQTLCNLKSDGSVSFECPEDDRHMMALAITHNETNDDRFEGWDRDEQAAWDAIDATERAMEAA